jgi:cytochrome c peroxidase
MAWTSSFFWDGGVFDLDLFSISPIENPVEMDEDMVRVLEKLKAHPKYPGLFKAAYGTDEINSARVLQALSQFMIMLISDQSRYDQYVTGDEKVLTAEEQAGLAVFESKCATCHSGVLQTDQTFRNNGLPLRPAPDEGRYRITLNPADKYRFKVPSLRNVAVSAPYMHDGRFRTLDAVLDHYRDGVARTENLDPVLAQGAKPGIALTEEEKTLLISFLHTLTDTAFLFDDRFSEY